VYVATERRHMAWTRLTGDLPMETLDRLTRTVRLADVPALGEQMINGRIRGRVVIDVNA